jgi:hypothetical protein
VKNKAPKMACRPKSVESIARMASRGEDISSFFTNNFVVAVPAKARPLRSMKGNEHSSDHRGAESR